jgi:two-component system, NtrC family, response regulator PilR
LRPSASTPSIISSEIPPDGLDLEDFMNGLERDLLVKALERTGGMKRDAAHLLKLNARSFRYRMDKYGIGRRNGGDGPGDADEEADG